MRNYKQQGTISIEFAMSSIVLFMMIFAVFELSRFIYINNLVDIAITESSRDSRIHQNGINDNYKKLLEQSLSQDSLWSSLAINTENYDFQAQCYKDFNDLTNNTKDNTECNKSELAIYTLTYTYHPLFIFNGVTTRKITRSVLVQNEYQGWKENEA
ncbi:pilus assembly protein [Photobacterium carnosum]|uniref:TadE/TadG family type IV pilus assembly protein n=1 Tax=Photobacterium carnosum TaxID=2023717 RepID=UPI001C91FE53|nr:TadE/TadG family type IV pilus assembly protein [Photobacterium carnosum]MBY3787052.1 pilus assembly protein [Photobacterium carnosum]MCD9532741.1 pilus assembly protein [Photobacterium carnosum]